jgi:TM2 domain-containing membrane protein YozV
MPWLKSLLKGMTIAVALLAPTGPAFGQRCATFEAVPSTASLTIGGSATRSSGSPATFCGLGGDSRYRISIAAPGYETRSLNFSLNDNNTISLSGGSFGLIGRSLLIPGWGQFSMGRPLRGTWAFALTAAAGADLVRTYYDYEDEKDKIDVIAKALESATTQQQREALEERLLVQSNHSNVAKDHYTDTFMFAAYVHASSVLETFFLSRPAKIVSVDGSVVNISTTRMTGTRAAIQSALVPGLGQKYMGRHFKGTFYQTVFLTGAVLAIQARKEYRTAEDDYDLSRRRLSMATTPTELLLEREGVGLRWADLRDKERTRDITYIATASIWFINLLDAALISKPDTREGRLGFDTSYNGSSVEAGLTWRY